MKKALLILIALFTLIIGYTNLASAQGGDDCACGFDEDGECIPANEDGSCP